MSISDILLEQVVRLHADRQNRRRDETEECDPVLWAKAEELGLPLAMCPEAAGGFELKWSELFDVLAHSASCGEPAPLGDTLVANALLCAAGQAPAQGPVFLSVPSGFAGSEPGLDLPADARVLTSNGAAIALASPAGDADRAIAARPPQEDQLILAGALLRVVQIAGALQGALDLSVRYAQERSQFGRPLSKFQAVQHMLAQLAGEAVATAAAARMACARMDEGDGSLAVAVAKLRAGRAVEKGAMLAHQIHGAIGVTLEYPLARLSRNMWRWSEDFGGQRHWAVAVGRAGLARGAWETVIAASDPIGASDDG